ncbi:cytochrome c551 [Exiguobacterium sp. s150]|uniref:cytochrome c551 n=1 Tax=Exiguobacterium sp. s150 TaxID=2751221 RepID=UPI001BE95453|nr:cytochrome c [Exiguobacterium sp. s150]
MKKWMMAIGLGAMLTLGACGGGDEEDTSGNDSGTTTGSIDAEAVYAQNCAACHGANLEGMSGPALTDVGARLSAEDIEGIIRNGKGAMPANVIQDDDEIAAVSAWLAEKK